MYRRSDLNAEEWNYWLRHIGWGLYPGEVIKEVIEVEGTTHLLVYDEFDPPHGERMYPEHYVREVGNDEHLGFAYSSLARTLVVFKIRGTR